MFGRGLSEKAIFFVPYNLKPNFLLHDGLYVSTFNSSNNDTSHGDASIVVLKDKYNTISRTNKYFRFI